jgi:hypothetical protein
MWPVVVDLGRQRFSGSFVFRFAANKNNSGAPAFTPAKAESAPLRTSG